MIKIFLLRIKIKSLYENQSDIRELIKNLKKENIKVNDRLIKRYEFNKISIADLKKSLKYYTTLRF